MKTLIVDEKNSNKKIDRYITAVMPDLPFSIIQKTFRKKDVKVNGVRVKQDYIVAPGDKIELYITDTLLEETVQRNADRQDKGFEPVYEDDNIIIVNKKQGIPVHPDKDQPSGTLIDNIRKYLKENNISIAGTSSFQPMLCHRLDRNTGGLVLAAKNQESLDILLEKIETREIKKFYLCMVKGKPDKNSAILKAFLFKDESKSRVYINNNKTPGSLEIITKYKLISYDAKHDISKLEVELVTGRTHQIRAHLAYIGHPVIGDGKYGSNTVNRPLGAKRQALWAYKLEFDFKDAGKLNYLKSRTFEVKPEFKVL
ncbi:MAG: RluA family pseudouridine synthase [Ruminiclostridium sp.]|nr:RluA family pseudouridine synthase [Ruminiclostridium sp.]